MAEERIDGRLKPNGNLTVFKITEEEGQGLIITWLGNFIPTVVDCVGDEKPVYDWIKQKFSDLKNATGESLNLVAEDGRLIGIGERGKGAEVKVIQKDK